MCPPIENSKLEAVLASVGEGGYPDTFIEDATRAYTEDAAVYDGKVEAVVAENEALRAENLALKSANYDLIMSGVAEPPTPSDGDELSDGNEPEDEDTETETLDQLFDEH